MYVFRTYYQCTAARDWTIKQQNRKQHLGITPWLHSTATFVLSLQAVPEMRIGFQAPKKQAMPSERPDDGDEVMKSRILPFSEEAVYGLLLILACSGLACRSSCCIKNVIIFVGKVQLFKIKKWFYDISVPHFKHYLPAAHFKQRPWQN